MKDLRITALAQLLDVKEEEVETFDIEDNLFEAEGGEYLVVTEEEADVLWNEALESYVEEVIYLEIPKNMQYYFDDEKWKSDARMNGRGHALSIFDGKEEEEIVNGTTFYIYRTN